MASYIVKWEIEVDADSPEEAVRQAYNDLFPHPGNGSTATFFDVIEGERSPDGKWTTLDLNDLA
jgi:hypothetical protein